MGRLDVRNEIDESTQLPADPRKLAEPKSESTKEGRFSKQSIWPVKGEDHFPGQAKSRYDPRVCKVQIGFLTIPNQRAIAGSAT